MKENLVVTGKTIDEVSKSTNNIIQMLANRIITLENKLKNTSGDSQKVESNVIKVNSDKEHTYLDVVTSNGKFRLEMTRKE